MFYPVVNFLVINGSFSCLETSKRGKFFTLLTSIPRELLISEDRKLEKLPYILSRYVLWWYSCNNNDVIWAVCSFFLDLYPLFSYLTLLSFPFVSFVCMGTRDQECMGYCVALLHLNTIFYFGLFHVIVVYRTLKWPKLNLIVALLIIATFADKYLPITWEHFCSI